METNVPNEAELLERALRYERQALAQIYDLYSPGIYRYAFRLLGDAALAEDCVSETFSRFLQALRARKGPRDYLQAYLYRTAHNWIADLYRKTHHTPEELSEETADSNTDPEDEASHRIRQARIRSAVQQLTPDQQQIIVLKFIEGWENEEIAVAVRKPVGAVKSLQHRALASLQRFLGNEELL